MTILQRPNTAVLFLILLALAGVALALLLADARSEASHRSDHLSSVRDHIAFDIVLISDTVRGLLLPRLPTSLAVDPKNEAEKKIKRDAEEDLWASFGSITEMSTN